MRIRTRPPARTESRSARMLRRWLLVVIGCALGLLAIGIARYPAYFVGPGAIVSLAQPVIALVIYAVWVLVLPLVASRIPHSSVALRVGIIVGLIAGAVGVLGTVLVSLFTLPQGVVSVITGAALLSLFLLFGIAGFVGGRRTHSFWLGVGAAIWSAIVAVLIVVTFSFLLLTTSLPQLAHNALGNPDFPRSGWTDVRAFAIANTFANGFTYLAKAPEIAAALGVVGSGIEWLKARRLPASQS